MTFALVAGASKKAEDRPENKAEGVAVALKRVLYI